MEIAGVGGRMMQEAGVRLVAGITSVIGIVEILSSYKTLKQTLNSTISAMERERPDIVVLIDYWGFNSRVGMRARELGIKVLYYCCPQIWAWRQNRIHKLKLFADRTAVIHPFEVPFYEREGIPSEFVGHPVLDDMAPYTKDKTQAKAELGLDANKQWIALIPGSRRMELTRLLPVYEALVGRIRSEYPEHGIVMSIAPNVNEADFQDSFDRIRAMGVTTTSKNIALLYSASEAAVVTSGTAAFQATFRSTPIVVIYKMSPVTSFIMRRLVSIKNANMANIILGREAIPELHQGRANDEEIMKLLRQLVKGGALRDSVLAAMREVSAMFEGKDPSMRAATIAGELAGWAA